MKKRIFIPDLEPGTESFTLSKKLYAEEWNHLSNVLRPKEGDELFLLNGKGLVLTAIIETLHKKELNLKITAEKTLQRKSVQIILAQAILKNQRMDWFMEKAAELGADRIIPVFSEFAQTKNYNVEGRQERWTRICISALKQSGNPFIPIIEDPVEIDNLSNQFNDLDTKILVHPDANALLLLESLDKINYKQASSVLVLVGPEGGFADDEVLSLKAQGFDLSQLGPNILRGETAGVCAGFLLSQFLHSRLS